MAKNGAVKKDSTVAILINMPISDMKYTNIKMVPILKNTSQNQYMFLYDLLVSKSTVFVIALGDASKVVMVVLNMVVKAAAAIKIETSSPKLFV
jgi:hypothetical protein